MLRKLLLLLALCAGGIDITHAAVGSGYQVFSNNGVSTLAAAASSSATTITVSSSASFPAASTGGNWFVATLEHLTSGLVTADEIVKVTNVSGNTWTVVRAQEGTSALSWSSGDTVTLLPTAGGLAQFGQAPQIQSGQYNYAVDTGSTNAYSIALTPGLQEHVVGLPITFKAANTNTGNSTLNDGSGGGNPSIVLPLSTFPGLTGGEIQAGAFVTVVYDGVYYELLSSSGVSARSVLLNPPGGAAQTITGPIILNASFPEFLMITAGAPANQGIWLLATNGSQFVLQALSDNESVVNNAIVIQRSGATIASIALSGTSQTGTTQANSDNSTNFATTAFVHSVLTNSPALGGVPTAPTPSYTDNSTKIATTAFAYNLLANSPALGGTPTVPTAASSTNTTQAASTAFVQSAIAAYALVTGSVGASGSITILVNGAPHGWMIIKWGFESPGLAYTDGGLQPITFPVAFPNDCYFAFAISNRNTNSSFGFNNVLYSSLSTIGFEAVLDSDSTGHTSGQWFAIGD